MKIDEALDLDRRFLFQNYKRVPLLACSGAGATVFDENGKRYHDFISGVGCNALGYGDPVVANLLRKAASEPLHVSNLYHHPFSGPLAKALSEATGLDRVLFQNSGGEAVEASLKIARAYFKKKNQPQRYEIVAFTGSFHGRTFGALSVTANEKYRAPFEPLLPGVRFLPFNQIAALKEGINDRTAAVLIEPLQGEGGLTEVSEEFLKALRKRCDETGALLILDEIQSGCGRTGKFLHSQHFSVKGDLLTLGKPLGLGLPLAAVLAREEVAAALSPGDHGSTFGGNPLACRLSLELMSRLQERLQGQIEETGQYFRQRLEGLKTIPGVEEIRGKGLMLGIKLGFDGGEIVDRAFEAGFLINRTAVSVLRLLPPFVVPKENIDLLMEFLPQAIRAQAAKQ